MKLGDALKITTQALIKKGLAGWCDLGLAYLDLRREPLEMSSLPVMIQIEPTLYCNLECRMCVNPLSGRARRHMAFHEFKRIVDGISSLKKISLVGAGEPLVNPDIFKMVSYAKSKGILIGFATNGMLLNDRACNDIIESRTDWVNISVDSADKDNYERIRKLASFERLLDNIKRFIEAAGKRAIPDISIWFVIMKDNMDELPAVIRLAASLGVKKVSAQLEHSWGDERIKRGMMTSGGENLLQHVKQLLKRARRQAFESKIEFNYVNVPDDAAPRACKWPWKSCYITAEGFITPCCLQGSDPGKIKFGNIFEDDFKTIWNNAAYRRFREALKSRTPPGICMGCTSYFRSVRI